MEFLVSLAAGNLIYIWASVLARWVNQHRDLHANVLHMGSFIAGITLLWRIRVALEPYDLLA